MCDDGDMPLSDDEQKILSQIEQQLHETDPDLANEVATTTVYTHAARNIKWSVLGFIIGLTVIVLTLSISFWLAFLGFAIMLAAALYFEQNMRKLGKAGMNQLSMRVGSGGLRNAGDRNSFLRRFYLSVLIVYVLPSICLPRILPTFPLRFKL